MRHRSLSILGLLGLALLNSLSSRSLGGEEPKRSDRPPQSKLPSPVEQVLWWLPVDTQTVVVARGPSKFLEAFGRGQGVDGIFIGSWPPSMVHEDKPTRIAVAPIKLLVEGSRQFRAPTGLGLMRYEGAMIAVFEHDIDDQTAKSLHEGATQTETITGRRVSLFKTQMEKDDWTIYVTQPSPNVLISATHRGYLAELLGRMDQRAGERAIPDSLPEWKHLNPTARLWGVRHYDRKDAELDPTSPSGPWAVQDDQAVGLVFAYDPPRHETIVRHLSRSKDASRVFSKLWADSKPEVREVGPGMVKLSATLRLDQFQQGEADMFFRLSVALGHGLCL